MKDDTGSKVAETVITYDSTSLTSISGVVNHDDTNFGTGDTSRGNSTVIQSWTGSSYLSTTLYYDTTGQVTKVTDPGGNSTSFGYADRYFTDNGANPPSTYSSPKTNAYVTQVSLPMTGSLTFGYYYNTGQLAQAVDQNSADRYYHYTDPLDRITLRYGPLVNGGRPWRLTQYTSPNTLDVFLGLNDTAPSAGCSSCRHDEIAYDGLGRPTRAALVNDPEGADYVDIGYDSNGRIQSVSNPYRSTSDPTYGVESETYDALNRVLSITHADNNAKQAYYGAAVASAGANVSQLCPASTYGLGYPLVTVDEAGNRRELWKDGLGRIIEVDEPDPASGSLSLSTCYAYDPLGNLTQVVQGVQTRSFIYDGLSRLISATNPESGTTTYAYTGSKGAFCAGDPRLPCSRTDARGITTTYTYDALGRLTSRTYSDRNTAAVYYYYDESSVTVGQTAYALTNTRGRLSHTETSSGRQPVVTIQSYDAAGHTVALWQCEVNSCTMRASQYSYDLAGDVTSWVHPYGYTVTNTFDNAQNLVKVSSSLTGSYDPPTIATFNYTPFGRASQITYGCTGSCTPQVQVIGYNKRLQVNLMQFGPAGVPPSTYCFVYNYYPNVAAPSSCSAPPSGAGDNGLIRSWLDISPPLRSGIGYTGWPDLSNTSSFAYDSLNRLTRAVADPYGPPPPSGSGQVYMNLSFYYDRYGNMTCVPSAYSIGYCSQNTFDPTTNRLTQISGSFTPTYDADGNLTSDGTNSYTWDAEGRLIQETGSNGTYTYEYNGLGQLADASWALGHSSSSDTEYLYDAAGHVIGLYNNDVAGDQVETFPNDAAPSPYAMYQSGGELDAIPRDVLGSTTQEGAGDSYFNPWGNPIYICELYGGDYLSFAGFTSVACSCYPSDPSPCGAYNNQQGRWMSPTGTSPDVTDPQSLNQYSYADNDPTSPMDSPQADSQQPWPPPNAAGMAENAREAAIQLIRRNKHCLDFLKRLGQKLRQAIDPTAGEPSEQDLENQINNYKARFDDTNPYECADTSLLGNVIHFNFWNFLEVCDRPLIWIHESFHGLPGYSANDRQMYNAAYEAEHNTNHVPAHPNTTAWNSMNYEKILEKNCGPKKKCGKQQ